MWAIPTGTSSVLKKKKNQVKSPSPESRVPETGSDPPIGSDRDSGCDRYLCSSSCFWTCAGFSGFMHRCYKGSCPESEYGSLTMMTTAVVKSWEVQRCWGTSVGAVVPVPL